MLNYRVITGQFRKFLTNTPFKYGEVNIRLIENSYTLEAGFPAYNKTIGLDATGHLPVGLEIACNGDFLNVAAYEITEPDGKKFTCFINYDDGSPVSIQELRAGGMIADPPDTVLSLIAAKIAEKSITLLKTANQNVGDFLAGDDTLFAAVSAGNYRLRAELFMSDESGGLSGILISVGGLNGLATFYFYGLDEGNLLSVNEAENDSPISVTGSNNLKVIVEGVTVSDGVTPIQIRFAGNGDAGARMRAFSTLTLSKI